MNKKELIGRLRDFINQLETNDGGSCLLPPAGENGFPLSIGPLFADRATSVAYGEAFETMLMLRQQPGAVASKNDERQFVIGANLFDKNRMVLNIFYVTNDVFTVSPCFESKDKAHEAIKTIGEQRLVRMFKTLHHVGSGQ